MLTQDSFGSKAFLEFKGFFNVCMHICIPFSVRQDRSVQKLCCCYQQLETVHTTTMKSNPLNLEGKEENNNLEIICIRYLEIF